MSARSFAGADAVTAFIKGLNQKAVVSVEIRSQPGGKMMSDDMASSLFVLKTIKPFIEITVKRSFWWPRKIRLELSERNQVVGKEGLRVARENAKAVTAEIQHLFTEMLPGIHVSAYA